MRKLFTWLIEKVDAGDCLLAVGFAVTGYGIYAVYGYGWACIVVGAALVLFAYAGQAVTLMCSMLAAARGQKK